MVAHRTLTPFVRVRILHPLPKIADLRKKIGDFFIFAFPSTEREIFGFGFFTALNNGPVSAAISFLRTLVFRMAAILLLSPVWKVDGIWASVVVAELMAAVASLVFMYLLRKRYKY